MTRRCEALDELVPRAEAEFSPEDARKYRIKDGDTVEITSRRGTIDVTAKVTGKSNPGVVFMPFHFAECAANVLTGGALDPIAKIPEYKVSAIKVRKKESGR